MKEELKKGTFWGTGVGTGLSLVVLVWMGVVYLAEPDKNYAKWVEVSDHDIRVERYVYRYSTDDEGEKLIVTGQYSGDLSSFSEYDGVDVTIAAKVYNPDGVYLQSCSDNYRDPSTMTSEQEFSLTCRNLNDNSEIGNIKFQTSLEVKQSDLST